MRVYVHARRQNLVPKLFVLKEGLGRAPGLGNATSRAGVIFWWVKLAQAGGSGPCE
jgi:hypothetical protein